MSQGNHLALDADLILLDFQDQFDRDPEKAVRRLVLLLLDELACCARAEYLLGLKQKLETARPDLSPRLADAPFDNEIRLICEVGLPAAQEEGKLTPEVVHRLHRLTCDSEALMAAHRRLLDPEPLEAAIESEVGLALDV